MTSKWMNFRRDRLLTLTLLTVAVGLTRQSVHAGSLNASDGATFDSFGYSVSLSGTIGLAGAPQDDVFVPDQGSAYVFRSLDTAVGTITQNAKLTASDFAFGDRFGHSVSLSGTIGLVGAPLDFVNFGSQGSAYVFRNLDTVTGTVTQNVKLIAFDGVTSDFFGSSVSLSGTMGLVGAYGDDVSFGDDGSAYVFRSLDIVGGTIFESAKLIASDRRAADNFGYSVSLSGAIGLVGAPLDDVNFDDQGSAYIFTNLNSGFGTFTQNVKLIASDGFAGDELGFSVSLSGTTALVGARRDDINFGDQGSAYVFRNFGVFGTVTQNAKLIASDGATSDNFGHSVSLSGTTGLVGAPFDDTGSNTDQGSAYLFRNLDTATGAVTQNVKLTASDGAANDRFGTSVSLSGDVFTIGAEGKNSFTGRAYTGTVSSVTTLDVGSAIRTIDGISFISQDDWIIGQTTSANQVTMLAGNAGNVTVSGKAVYIGRNAGSNNNTLVMAGTLTANQVNIGAAGNSGNVLQLGSGGTSGSLSSGTAVVNRGTLIFNRSDTLTQGTNFGAISGSGGVTQAGTGTTVLTSASTYTGTTTVNGGTLKITGSSNSTSVTVNNGGTFVVGSFNGWVPAGNTLTVNAGGLATTTDGVNNDVQNVTLAGGTVASGVPDLTYGSWYLLGNITATGNTTSTISALRFSLFSGNHNLTVDAGSTLNVTGFFRNDGGISKLGGGTLVLSGQNTYTGATTISAGTLQIGNGGTTGSLSPSSAITNNANLTFKRSDTITQGTHFGSITGTGSLTQAGSGTTVLTGANSYNGATTVNAGKLSLATTSSINGTSAVTVGSANLADPAATLNVNGSLSAGSSITVQATGTLSGSGTISAVSTAVNGTLSPGNSIGTLTFASGNLALGNGAPGGSGASTNLEIDSSASLDQIILQSPASTLTYDGTLNITFNNTPASGTYDLFNFVGSFTSDFEAINIVGLGALNSNAGTWTNTYGGLLYTFTLGTGNLVLSASAVPEPLAASAVLLLASRVLGRRNRESC